MLLESLVSVHREVKLTLTDGGYFAPFTEYFTA